MVIHLVEKAIPDVICMHLSLTRNHANEFRFETSKQWALKKRKIVTEQLKEFMKAMQQKGPKVIIATLGKMEALGMMEILGIDLES